jgi:hypothetical protein
MTRFVVCATVFLLPVANFATQAQQNDATLPRVRVTYGCDTDCERVTGNVLAFSTDSMVVRADGRPGNLEIALASISRYELDRGPQENRTGTLVGVGIFVGIVGGGIVGFIVNSPNTGGCGPSGITCDAGGTLIGAGVGLAIGVGTGYLIGKLLTDSRWVEVDLGYAQVGLQAQGLRRFGLSAAIPF